jgi:hypothetical protein
MITKLNEDDMEAGKEETRVDGPKRTGKPVEQLGLDTLTGKLFPWDQKRQQPVLLSMPGSQFHYIALFSTKQKLDQMLQDAEVSFDSIKQVQDGREFMSGLMESGPETTASMKVILDPYFTSEGRVRFTELMLDGA